MINYKILKMSNVRGCPLCIFLPSHYREDGSCRCDESICEHDGCTVAKFDQEIYCYKHCKEHFGEDYAESL